jgi:hypothetical protein
MGRRDIDRRVRESQNISRVTSSCAQELIPALNPNENRNTLAVSARGRRRRTQPCRCIWINGLQIVSIARWPIKKDNCSM